MLPFSVLVAFGLVVMIAFDDTVGAGAAVIAVTLGDDNEQSFDEVSEDWIWGRKGVGLGVRGRGGGRWGDRGGWLRSDGKGEVGEMEKKKVCEDQILGIIKLCRTFGFMILRPNLF